jgi:hypothetical protein
MRIEKHAQCGVFKIYTPSPSIIRIIKSGIMRWAQHMASTEKINSYQVLVAKCERNRLL